MERQRTIVRFVLILILAAIAAYLVIPTQHPDWLTNLIVWQPEDMRDLEFRQGLDLQGGSKLLLVADLPEGQDIEVGAIDMARQTVERRVNALGLTEPVVQVQGDEHIIVEIPGIEDPERAVETIQETALLEFVNPPAEAPQEILSPGTTIRTDFGGVEPIPARPDAPITETLIFETILTGADLQKAYPMRDSRTSQPVVAFELQSDAADTFAEFTGAHVGQPLCIVLDKQLLSCPRIDSRIPSGEGIIQGGFTAEAARQLAIQLQAGALPIPLEIESYQAIGPQLGEISVQQSIRAGVVGLSIVLLFMLVYYRLNGLAADLALGLYVLLNMLAYKLIPVTLTLPGIAGFLLSVGMAVDANILVFERMKEELRHGRSLRRAAEAGFSRAWTSVRDSNLATLLTCFILYSFGNAFAASLVKGFAATLALGTIINLFTAIFVTRTFVRAGLMWFSDNIKKHPWMLGL
ncbi:MAG: protein translocase subunit SecD [Chloroflexi bacterium]|jgi:protein-export membrane protein SecD|nr:protein translocase subunit SecD [Chloroflexota bacterium]